MLQISFSPVRWAGDCSVEAAVPSNYRFGHSRPSGDAPFTGRLTQDFVSTTLTSVRMNHPQFPATTQTAFEGDSTAQRETAAGSCRTGGRQPPGEGPTGVVGSPILPVNGYTERFSAAPLHAHAHLFRIIRSQGTVSCLHELFSMFQRSCRCIEFPACRC